MAVVGKKFSVDFEQATEVNGNTQILVQSEGQPVEKASVEQLGVALMEEDIIVNPDGIYPKMSVGFAENVVGDGSATSEEFSFRPTAGVNRNTLNDGAARIHTLKGRSVVHNQLLKDRNTVSSGIRHTIVSGVDTWSGTSNSVVTGILLDLTVGHKVLFLQNIIKNPNSISITFKGAGAGKEVFMTVTSQSTEVYWMLPQGVSMNGVVISLKVVDLTQMFGTGNEPATVEEYYQRKPILLNEDEYNEGKLVNFVPKAIKTTGFNQWDEQWEVGTINGGTGTNSSSNTDIRSSNYIPILPATPYYFKCTSNLTAVAYNANKEYIGYMLWGQKANLVETTPSNASYIRIATFGDTYGAAYKNDICVNIAWDEYAHLNGTYKPYKPFERDLGNIIAKYFTGGVMRSAGNVADEIRFNSATQKWEAVQNVGVRAYTEGDENDTAVTTDGTNTNYALVTPDVKEMDEIPNFDFDVSDYGTEELIVADGVESAPLSASIEYSPNVLAMLKNAPDIADDVDALKSQVAALTAQLVELMATNNE